MVNKPLIRPYFLGGVALGGGVARIPMINLSERLFFLGGVLPCTPWLLSMLTHFYKKRHSLLDFVVCPQCLFCLCFLCFFMCLGVKKIAKNDVSRSKERLEAMIEEEMRDADLFKKETAGFPWGIFTFFTPPPERR